MIGVTHIKPVSDLVTNYEPNSSEVHVFRSNVQKMYVI